MTQASHTGRENGPRSAAEIESDIRRTRAELGFTLDALAYQVAPRRLIGKGVDMITQSIKGNEKPWIDVGEALRANPIPFALIGTGVAWLLAANSGIAGGGSKGAGAAQGAACSAGEAADTTSECAGERAEYGRPATERVRRVGRSLRASVGQHPLLIGLAGLICGAAIAALLPSSRREQDWLDTTRGELWDKAERLGRDAADRVRSVAERNAGAADL
jgi:hypothetical protein